MAKKSVGKCSSARRLAGGSATAVQWRRACPLRATQGHKVEWEALCDQLQQLASAGGAKQKNEGKWQERAKQAEYELLKLLNMLLALPDPAPVLATASGLSAKIVGAQGSLLCSGSSRFSSWRLAACSCPCC